MNDLKNVLKTLFHLQSQISLLVETLNEIGNNYQILQNMPLDNFFNKNMNLENSTHTLISNYSIIMFCSFMDEYEEHFNTNYLKNIDPERILRVRKKNSYGVNRIKIWKDMKTFRNQLVAHNFKVKGKSFFSDEIERLTFRIPNTISEKNLFSGIIYYICINLKNEFIEVSNSLLSTELMLDKIEFTKQEIDNEKELTEIAIKMLD